ncbi:hypothetical protein CROQUDRAFT_129384 [Cronartium quercuum f. sp. fusiforme G11]|uniref:Transcription factor domain-containing protein n=1 Tax=Cronartium quercuum f. sp. fusiforme G11 TaxID=708437 RepID=A0A9P6NXX4_9BASI|nr:hypothetical protein CROQUDRAFT_129384 [Cronartium quercuum f. sp. fusiforme G11]
MLTKIIPFKLADYVAHQTRKIRCSGETDTGCTACRNRSQPCIYEPTAAMGRPRKYPRSPSPGPHTFQSTLLVPSCPTLWDDPPAGFGRQMSVPEAFTFQNPTPPLVSGSVTAWRAASADLSTSSLFSSSHIPTLAHRNSIASVPPYSAPETRHLSRDSSAQNMNGSSFNPFGLLSQPHYPTSENLLDNNPPPDSSSSRQLQPVAQPPAPLGFSFDSSTGLDFNEACSPPQVVGQIPKENCFSVERGTTDYLPATIGHDYQSPEGKTPYGSFAEIHPSIYGSDLDAVYQHFKGWALVAVTQCHLEFLLREKPNTGISDSTYQYPSMTNANFYNTILADFISFITSGNPSAPDIYESLETPYESMFAQMLRCDRGGNQAPDGGYFPSLNPLEHHTAGELQDIYSHFLAGNPFRWLFTHEKLDHHGDYQSADAALVATIVGWNLFERTRRAHAGIKDSAPAFLPSYMPYFEFAEEELMNRALWETDAVSTVQALTLLGAFRTVDGQPRCGWALLSVAQLLARQATLFTQACKRVKDNSKRARSEDLAKDSQLNGLFWLLTLVRTWTTLSLQLPYKSGIALLRLGPSLPDCVGEGEWAGDFLSDAAQLLDVFSTLNRDNPTAKSRYRNVSHLDSLGNWLADLARRRCQLIRPSREGPHSITRPEATSNPNANSTLAVIISILALNKYHPFQQIPLQEVHLLILSPSPFTAEMLQIATTEAAGAMLAAASGTQISPNDALVLRVLRGAFPYLVAILNATVSSVASRIEVERAPLLETVIEFLSSFVSAGFSLHQSEDQISVNRLRTNLILFFPQPPLSLPDQPLLHGSSFEAGQMVTNNPASLGSTVLSSSFSNPTSSKSSSTTMTGGTGPVESEPSESNAPVAQSSSTRSPVEIQQDSSTVSRFETNYSNIENYVPVSSYGVQTIYDYRFVPNYHPTTTVLTNSQISSIQDITIQRNENSEINRSPGSSSPDYSVSY